MPCNTPLHVHYQYFQVQDLSGYHHTLKAPIEKYTVNCCSRQISCQGIQLDGEPSLGSGRFKSVHISHWSRKSVGGAMPLIARRLWSRYPEKNRPGKYVGAKGRGQNFTKSSTRCAHEYSQAVAVNHWDCLRLRETCASCMRTSYVSKQCTLLVHVILAIYTACMYCTAL